MFGDVGKKHADSAPTTTIVDMILACWTSAERYDPPEVNSFVRCSSLSPKFCPRREGLKFTEQIVEVRENDADGQWNLSIGEAYHRVIQQQALQALPWGVLLAWWKCKACKRLHHGDKTREAMWGAIQRPHACEECEDVCDFILVEPHAEDRELGLSGHPDGLLMIDGRLEGLELKSINDDPDPGKASFSPWHWNRVDNAQGGKPIEAHVWQCHGYMMLWGLDRWRIMYVKKASGPLKQLIAEHVVIMDPEIVEKIRAAVEETRRARLKILEPRLPGCKTKKSPGAKYCCAVNQCFE